MQIACSLFTEIAIQFTSMSISFSQIATAADACQSAYINNFVRSINTFEPRFVRPSIFNAIYLKFRTIVEFQKTNDIDVT